MSFWADLGHGVLRVLEWVTSHVAGQGNFRIMLEQGGERQANRWARWKAITIQWNQEP